MLDWYDEGLPALIDVLTGADPGEPVWNWSASPATAGFWARRMALETAVHRVDGESAHGRAEPIDPVLAADGIDEVFEVFVPRVLTQGPAPGLDGTLHLHVTDLGGGERDGGEWLVRPAPNGAAVTHEHARADAAVRGPASELLLVLWGRRPPDAVDVHGDRTLLDRWAAAMRF